MKQDKREGTVAAVISAGSESHSSSRERRPSGTVRLGRQDPDSVAEHSGDSVVCPACRLKNPTSEIYCAECGFLLTSTLEDSGIPMPSAEEMARFPHLEDTSGRSYPLRPGVNTLGRENTDILIADRSVSRYHGMIVYDEERDLFSVEDSGSTNGSRVNGEPLLSGKPRPIRPGDQLTFGNIILHFVAEGDARVNLAAPIVASSAPAETTIPSNNSTEEVRVIIEPAGRMVLLRGSGPREVLLGEGVNTIGRHVDNSLCLSEDRYVSGHHAKIEAEGDLCLLLDLGSTNGTFLNGLRLTTNTAIAISDGDEIMFGGSLFQFQRMGALPEIDPTIERTLLGAPTLDALTAPVIVGRDTAEG